MLTMTRIPSDSFLPSGAALDTNQRSISFGSLNDHSSTSVISPLSLPHALHNLNFLDESTITNLPSPNYSHSPSVSAVPRPRHQLISPRQSLPLPSIREQRSVSLSPTRHRTRSGVASPPLVRTSNSSMTSPDSKDRLEQERQNMERIALMSLLRRREEQTRKLFENWQVERNYLEASRNRAEALFEEERKIMNDERAMWLSERLQLEQESQRFKKNAEDYQKKVEALMKEVDQMACYIKGMRRKPGAARGTFDGTVDAAVGFIRGGGSDSPGTSSGSSSKFRSPSDGLSPGSRAPNLSRGQTMPESQPFIPLDPRMQGLSPGTRSPTTQQEKIPSIDIQEVIPSLEGIRVKAGAVQKPTFTDGSLSPPGGPKRPKLSVAAGQPESTRSRTIPAVTQEALQAPEAHRLTMHAGHTPNHSMSLSRLHTVESTQNSTEVTNTTSSSPTGSTSSSARNSGAATPTHVVAENDQSQVPLHPGQGPVTVPGADKDSRLPDAPGGLGDHVVPVYGDLDDQEDHDPALKGPLFLRNLPAADEPFIQQLSEKLTLVKDNNLTPTVLKNDLLNQPTQPAAEPAAKPVADAALGGDGAQDAGDGEAEAEEEIPIRFKKTSNFGAPLGELGK